MSRFSYQYSIQCLSDGSEFTDPVLLLTIERGTTFVARYALNGLTSLSARLAADQRVPLHTIRACFASSSTAATAGLPSLLLASSQAGVAELTFCGAVPQSAIETIARLILGSKRAYPLLRTCQVPKDGAWYQVYQDNHLRAHGKYVGEHIVWIYTLLLQESNICTRDTTPLSIAVIPPHVSEKVLQPFPADVPSELDCVFYLQRAHGVVLSPRFVFVDPTLADDGLLKRAASQARQLATSLPFAFFFRQSRIAQDQQNEQQENNNHLTSGAKLCLSEWTVSKPVLGGDIQKDQCNTETIISVGNENSLSREIKPFAPDFSRLTELEQVWTGNPLADDNEIDLDDEDENQEEGVKTLPLVPHLLILGTGCASPSALRGSSGCALFAVQNDGLSSTVSLTALLDCGEGTLTNLYRHLPASLSPIQAQLRRIKFIWISHAHLDHYGGLVDCILAIHAARSSGATLQLDNGKSFKKAKTSSSVGMALLVIAPLKVLSFLRASLHGQPLEVMYRGVTHWEFEFSHLARDLRGWVSSICHLRSIPVDHCAHAYAAHLKFSCNGFRFVYSGDTRPSTNLIREITNATASDGGSVSLLLHEATFDDDPRGIKEALEKRHATVAEALQVAKQIQAKACLLTHFSQRYPNSPPGWEDQDNENPICFAVDGMWMPLTEAAMAKLPVLSQMVQQILQQE